ncbi:hypothetical protein D3C86_1957640 [compost metagenome]
MARRPSITKASARLTTRSGRAMPTRPPLRLPAAVSNSPAVVQPTTVAPGKPALSTAATAPRSWSDEAKYVTRLGWAGARASTSSRAAASLSLRLLWALRAP